MASSKEYLDYILDQLSGLENITYKHMMGEFIIYYNEKIIAYFKSILKYYDVNQFTSIMNKSLFDKYFKKIKLN